MYGIAPTFILWDLDLPETSSSMRARKKEPPLQAAPLHIPLNPFRYADLNLF